MTNITDLPKQSLTITVWHHDKDNQPEYIGRSDQNPYSHKSNFIPKKGVEKGLRRCMLRRCSISMPHLSYSSYKHFPATPCFVTENGL
jgi:hypothetical protein